MVIYLFIFTVQGGEERPVRMIAICVNLVVAIVEKIVPMTTIVVSAMVDAVDQEVLVAVGMAAAVVVVEMVADVVAVLYHGPVAVAVAWAAVAVADHAANAVVMVHAAMPTTRITMRWNCGTIPLRKTLRSSSNSRRTTMHGEIGIMRSTRDRSKIARSLPQAI